MGECETKSTSEVGPTVIERRGGREKHRKSSNPSPPSSSTDLALHPPAEWVCTTHSPSDRLHDIAEIHAYSGRRRRRRHTGCRQSAHHTLHLDTSTPCHVAASWCAKRRHFAKNRTPSVKISTMGPLSSRLRSGKLRTLPRVSTIEGGGVQDLSRSTTEQTTAQ